MTVSGGEFGGLAKLLQFLHGVNYSLGQRHSTHSDLRTTEQWSTVAATYCLSLGWVIYF